MKGLHLLFDNDLDRAKIIDDGKVYILNPRGRNLKIDNGPHENTLKLTVDYIAYLDEGAVDDSPLPPLEKKRKPRF